MSDKMVRTGHWSQERRLEFIDFRLLWEGRLNRADLTTFFRISVPQASLDLAKYQEVAPNNMVYDRTQKAYITTPDFKPVFTSFDSNHYLNELLGRENEIVDPDDSFIGWVPPVASLPLPARKVQPEILIDLIRAMQRKQALVVDYRSMTNEPAIRTLYPTAFAHDGHRWHVRAYCFKSTMFKDFVLGRFFKIVEFVFPPTSIPQDVDWNTFIDVVIGPNPNYDMNKRLSIEHDYQMVKGEAKIHIRKAQLYYLNRRLNLDVNSDGSIDDKQQIIMLRIDESKTY
ncbi:TPA: WYL domain-containing protein [Escherichia coli]|uniref:WYL domain-containing protein n=1 Tax=Escherichia coli TaxID=562 RepID=UPI0007752AF2|nr:WYL domain-containing protein [Escherichia coli]EEY4101251.1 WYL domain-containing protein [Escherichia coli]EFA4352227.1 WYL domain-containing protein [Escherichia coli]EFK8286926.1 WYL domain-containing protein [Escherichia coli]EFK8681565.1 WYL domain-containing protein [Escherichia coli]EFN7696147.1 WYL domain-containing protein [Escherichia coli]